MENSKQYPFPWMQVRSIQTQRVASNRQFQEISPATPVQEFNPVSCRILSIKFPPSGKLRIRKVITRSGVRPRYKYSSWKMGRMMHGESVHERNCALLLDTYPTYAEFPEQHAVIHYLLDGEEHFHYPDIHIQRGHFRGFLEVKEKADALEPEVARRSALMKQLLPAKGYQYYVVLAEDLARQPRLSNAGLIRRLNREPNRHEYEALRRQFIKRPAITWGEVLEGALGPKGRVFMFQLYLSGRVVFDIECPMSGDSLIEWTKPHNGLLTLVA